MECGHFRSKKPAALERLLAMNVSNNAAAAEASRRSCEILGSNNGSSGGSCRTTSTACYSATERVDRYFSVVSEKKKKGLEEALSDTVIEDAYPFTLGTGKRFDRFSKVAFGGL